MKMFLIACLLFSFEMASAKTDLSQLKTQDQAKLIIDLFGKFTSCKKNAKCKIDGYTLEKLDPNDAGTKPILTTFPDFFTAILKKQNRFVSAETFDTEDSAFPSWAFIAGELYLYYGLEENGDNYEYVNIYKIQIGGASEIVSQNNYSNQTFGYDVELMKTFLESYNDLDSQVSLKDVSFVGLEEADEGGTNKYRLNNGKFLCMISEEGNGFVEYCQ